MKPSFHVRPLNGPFDDPGLYIRMPWEGRAIMFDLGFTSSLSTRDILKTTDIFVSHTHMDHFIGFDNILRVSLKKKSPLRLYGPAGFINNVEGKLKSYSWNVIKDYPLELQVHETDGKSLRKTVFRASSAFSREKASITPFDKVLTKDPRCSVATAILDHQIPCLAFSIREAFHINIDKVKLADLSIPVGPWLTQFKAAIRENRKDTTFTVDNKSYSYNDLIQTASITRGQKVSYVVDAAGTKENRSRIIDLVRGSDILFIETFFLDEDKAQATERSHLTAKEAGEIAREAEVSSLVPLHFSSRYMDKPEQLTEEALESFGK